MPDRPTQVPNHAALVAMVLPRIAVPGTITAVPAEVDEQSHRNVAQQALEWQQLSSNALLWEMGAMTQGSDEGRAYALAGQMAAVGEQVGLAYGAGVEVALWNELGSEGKPEAEMGTRAMAEVQSHFVMGAGHSLANVALYALAMHKALQEPLRRAFKRKPPPQPFQPFSQNRADWISMNPKNAGRLEGVARESASPEVEAMIDAIVSFSVSKEWTDLVDRRGEDFHRWRPQSHGLTGVTKASPWTHSAGTRALGMGPMPAYDSAEGLAQEVARTADAAALRLAEAMANFLERFVVASEHLGGPRFSEA